MQRQPVRGREGHVLVRDAELVLRHHGTLDVSDGIREQHRLHNEVRRKNRHHDEQRAPDDASPDPPGAASRVPQPPQAETDEQRASGDREQSGEVVARGTDGGGVVAGLDQADADPEHANRHRQHGAPSGAHPPEAPRGRGEQRGRNQGADQMVGRGGARRRLQQSVVEHVERDERRAEQEQRTFVARQPPAAGGDGRRRGGGQGSRGHAPTLGTPRRAPQVATRPTAGGQPPSPQVDIRDRWTDIG